MSDERAPALDWRTRASVSLGSALLKLLASTWRVRVEGRETLVERHARGARSIILLWHGQMLAEAVNHRLPAKVLISEHRDGEIIARIVSHFGLGAVRGSSSRGGARALLEAAGILARGTDVAITPDGPRGPRHSFAPGALLLSHRTGTPMIAIVSHTDRAWRLRSWDAFEIPKPFARITIRYLPPRTVHASDARDAASQAEAHAAWMSSELARLEREVGDSSASQHARRAAPRS